MRLQNAKKALELAQVTRSVARAFMDAEGKRGVTGKTWNDTLKLLRATFKYLPAGGRHQSRLPDTPTRETEVRGVSHPILAGGTGGNLGSGASG